MKKIFITFIGSITLLFACKDEKAVTPGDLPAGSSVFINKHFSGKQINNVIKDMDGLTSTYKVLLNDGTQLEFKKDGSVTDIENTSGIPAGALPQLISDYVQANYTNQTITEWGFDNNRQSVKLSSGVELEFDLNGNFKRVDL